MPNIAAALKSEIARVARKEIRAETFTLKKALTTYRHDISALRKRVQGLERQLKTTGRAARASAKNDDTVEDNAKQLRFSATRFASMRKKLGLSAASMAKLLGVSALSVYKWEGGQTRPRRTQLEAIATIRGIGKREAQARLEAMST